MKKDSIKSIVVLGSICLVVAVLLAAVNYVTAPIIEAAAGAAASESLLVVLPDATGFEEVEKPEGAADTITGIHRDKGGSGYAVTLSTSSSYSQSPMTFTVGFGADGKIVAVEMTNYAETKNFGDYPQSYVGKDSALTDVDLAAGVTYSSSAFKAAIEDAFAALVSLGGISEGVKSEEQIVSELMAQALPGAVDNNGKFRATEMKVDSENIISVFVADNKIGYALLVSYNGEKLVCGLSVSGSVHFYDLEGNVAEADSAFAESIVGAVSMTDVIDKDLTTAQAIIAEGETLERIELRDQFGVISSAYRVTSPTRANEGFVFVTHSFGYKDPMTMSFVIDNGAITAYRNTGDFIQLSEYYAAFSMDLGAYREGLVGKTEETITDDDILVAGATISTGAVKRSIMDVFEAYKEVAAE